MRFIGIVLMVLLVVLLASCGNKGGRLIFTSDYPVMVGTYTYSFDVTSDVDAVVGTLVEDHFIYHLTTTTNAKDIVAYDDFGRVYEGEFSTTDGAFTITTDDPWQHQTTTIAITGNFDNTGQTGDGTFTMTFTSGFGDNDGAVVSGTWVSNLV